MPDPPRPMTVCPHCGVQVRSDRLEKHIRKVHAQPKAIVQLGAKDKRVKCEICNVSVLASNWDKHQARHAASKQEKRNIIPDGARSYQDSPLPAPKLRGAHISHVNKPQGDHQVPEILPKPTTLSARPRPNKKKTNPEKRISRYTYTVDEHGNIQSIESRKVSTETIPRPQASKKNKQSNRPPKKRKQDSLAPRSETCKICLQFFTKRGLPTHVRLKHRMNMDQYRKRKGWGTGGAKSHPPIDFNRCPICKSIVPPKDLEKHIRKVHPEVKSTGKHPSKSKNKQGKTTDEHTVSSQQQEHTPQAFSQSFDEPRDGSKYLGHMRREQGKFGSFPLHDDYDDESDAG